MPCPCRAALKATSQGHSKEKSTAGAQHGMCEVALAFTVLKYPHYTVRVCCSDFDVGSGRVPEAK
jgi:hypothetical protein